MLFDRIALSLSLSYLATCEQPSAPKPISAPLRELPWTKNGINFLHTTDTHGWHGGHLHEPQYSADWGDYISFSQHLRQKADNVGADLLVIDTGDRVEGNGLYDASDPKGKYTSSIFKHQHIDVITTGNHELYKASTSEAEYANRVPDFKDSYIASNVDIRNGKGELVPLAARFRKFTTKNRGVRVLAFGFLYNFYGSANNTHVQKVEDTVQEDWFQDAIKDKEIDLYLVAGHVPVRDTPEFDAVYKAIRNANWDTPIVFFGGHTHIRDYRKWEKRAYGIESGRYMETIGFVSISDLGSDQQGKVKAEASPKFERMYIDNNLFSLHHHSGTNASNFPTELGRNVSAMIRDDRKKLKLDRTFGCAPHDFWLNRAEYPSKNSLLSLLEEKILPDTFTTANASENPAIVMTNSGAMRFDIFAGPFTIDTTYLVCPFTSGFRQIKNVPYEAATQVLPLLNNQGPIPLRDLLSFMKGEEGWGEHRLDDLVPHLPQTKSTHERRDIEQMPLGADKDKDEPQVPGYTTHDDAGSDGDDTAHQPIVFYNVPNCVASNIGFDASDDGDKPETLDLVYNEFIQDWVLLALRYLGINYGEENTRTALEGTTFTDVISRWVERNWECKD
jgi:2',3'-cyclic-nucleotide 2'-phosphodiesterase (5'-nucleotidase family)